MSDVKDHFISRVDSQHRLTISKHFREYYGIEPGDYVKCEIIDNLGNKKRGKRDG